MTVASPWVAHRLFERGAARAIRRWRTSVAASRTLDLCRSCGTDLPKFTVRAGFMEKS